MVLLFIPYLILPKEVILMPEIIDPVRIELTKNYLYVIEKPGLLIYSLKNYKFFKRIGKKGNGPGEFKRMPSLAILSDSILLYSLNKVAFFSFDGIYKSEKILKFFLYDISYLTTGYVAEIHNSNRKLRTHSKDICLFDKEFNFSKILLSGPSKILGRPDKKFAKNYINHYIRHQVYKDRIYVSDTRKGFYFEVFNNQGNKLYIIDKKYKKYPVTQGYKDNALEKSSKYSRRRIKWVFPKYHPAFRFFKINNEKITVMKPAIKEIEKPIVQLDLKGNKLLERAPVYNKKMIGGLGKRYNKKTFVLIENSDEDWELHIENIKIE